MAEAYTFIDHTYDVVVVGAVVKAARVASRVVPTHAPLMRPSKHRRPPGWPTPRRGARRIADDEGQSDAPAHRAAT